MITLSPTVQETIDFVIDLYQNDNLVDHCMSVAFLVPSDMVIPALLHHAAKDYSQDPERIFSYLKHIGYSENDVTIVRLLHRSHNQTKKQYFDQILSNISSLTIKVADLVDNVAALSEESNSTTELFKSQEYKEDIDYIKEAICSLKTEKLPDLYKRILQQVQNDS